MKKNVVIRIIVAASLWLSLIGIAQAANRYVYYHDDPDETGALIGVCDDSTTDQYHTTLHAVAIYLESWDDGISNGLDEFELGYDDSYGAGTYHVCTLAGSGEKVYYERW